jgi:hypothetical protein
MPLKIKKPNFLKSEEEKEKDAQLKLSQAPILEKSIDAFEKDFTIRVKEDGTVIIKDSNTLLKLTPDSKGEVVIESSEGITKITVEKTK